MMSPRTIIESAVFKLTAWYLLLIMLVSLTFSAVLFRIYQAEFARGLGRQSVAIRELVPTGVPNLEIIRLRQIHESMEHLGWNLFWFNLVVLIAGGAAAYLLARRTLQPIHEAMEAQHRFTADASHELRTPLAAMRAELEVGLRDPNLNLGTAKELLTSSLEEVVKLNTLSDKLLQVARPSAESDMTAVDLRKTAEEVWRRLHKTAEARGIELENQVRPEMRARSNEHNLAELLTILVDNAIKYSSAETTVTIYSYASGGRVFVAVKDQGQGIAEEDLPHVFERFYRAEASRSKDQSGGYGLGLAIAKQLAESMHGEITVKSKVGRGTTFTVGLLTTEGKI